MSLCNRRNKTPQLGQRVARDDEGQQVAALAASTAAAGWRSRRRRGSSRRRAPARTWHLRRRRLTAVAQAVGWWWRCSWEQRVVNSWRRRRGEMRVVCARVQVQARRSHPSNAKCQVSAGGAQMGDAALMLAREHTAPLVAARRDLLPEAHGRCPTCPGLVKS